MLWMNKPSSFNNGDDDGGQQRPRRLNPPVLVWAPDWPVWCRWSLATSNKRRCMLVMGLKEPQARSTTGIGLFILSGASASAAVATLPNGDKNSCQGVHMKISISNHRQHITSHYQMNEEAIIIKQCLRRAPHGSGTVLNTTSKYISRLTKSFQQPPIITDMAQEPEKPQGQDRNPGRLTSETMFCS